MQTRNRKSLTIRDVARAAGVSPSTVSNVLNGRTHKMTQETLRRVQDTILALSYRPSSLARSLTTRRTSVVGIILSEIETPLFLQALPHMESCARDRGYNILLSVGRSAEEERAAVDLFLEKQAEGIVFFSSSEFRKDDYLEELALAGVPTVLVNRPKPYAQMSHINWDQREGVAEAVIYLARLGHRRIAHMIGPMSRACTHERLEGYRLGLAEAGLECRDDLMVDGDYTKTPEVWRRSILHLISSKDLPSAVIAADDTTASVAMRTFQAAGLRVPEDISVVGIDDQPFGPYLYPALTTLQLPILDAGKLAMEMVIKAIAEEADACSVVLPCRLIERESCGARVTAC